MQSTLNSEADQTIETVPNRGDHFKQYFEIVPGINDKVRDQVYRIRHEVYCEELQFEPLRADRREIDQFDKHSLHCLMRRNDETRELVGCTRLVLAEWKGVSYEMPFERACADSIDRSIIDPARLRRHEIAEVSRLAVSSRYRQRKHESTTPFSLTTADFGTPSQPRFPHIPVGLYLGSIAIAQRHGIKTLFVLTEPRLAQHLFKLGFMIKPIGSPIEHHGARLPSVMQIDEILAGMRPAMQPVWQAVNDQVDEYIAAHGTLPSHAELLPSAAAVGVRRPVPAVA